ncbi:hypothetical protein BVY03_00295 [bacterium K02(2017)]|nr:hypothetical protein BVY03_00295 [bacterium K02(2017)]
MPESVAILIPCYNEAITIKAVIDDFKINLPNAKIYVFDNNSTDQTKKIAQENGAIVSSVSKQGKGNVIQAMFKSIKADYYILIDGDQTYPVSQVHQLLDPVKSKQADMCIANRLAAESNSHFEPLHKIGNSFFIWLINFLFKSKLSDVLSGFRVLNHDTVSKLQLNSPGFAIETELTIKCLLHQSRLIEVPIQVKPRPNGSHSKINIMSDGIKILITIIKMYFTKK